MALVATCTEHCPPGQEGFCVEPRDKHPRSCMQKRQPPRLPISELRNHCYRASRLHQEHVVPVQHLPGFLWHLTHGPEELLVKEVPPVHLPVRPPEDPEGIQLAAGQRQHLPLHEPIQILEGHSGDGILVDHHAGAEGLHGVGHVGGQ